jgi:nitroimidazol reductase NimA-like FMN-containing flavoprotein (pyridoxamine 5'-phosphate oxidase superfamily)
VPSRRHDIRLTPDEQLEFLETEPFGVLATTGPTGDPHLVTLGFVLDGPSRVVLSTFGAAQKVSNVRRTPRGSFLVERTQPYDQICGVLLSGSIRIDDDPEHVATWFHRTKERSARLMDPRDLPPMDEEAVLAKRVLLVLDVDRVVSWDHRKLGGRY